MLYTQQLCILLHFFVLICVYHCHKLHDLKCVKAKIFHSSHNSKRKLIGLLPLTYASSVMCKHLHFMRMYIFVRLNFRIASFLNSIEFIQIAKVVFIFYFKECHWHPGANGAFRLLASRNQ